MDISVNQYRQYRLHKVPHEWVFRLSKRPKSCTSEAQILFALSRDFPYFFTTLQFFLLSLVQTPLKHFSKYKTNHSFYEVWQVQHIANNFPPSINKNIIKGLRLLQQYCTTMITFLKSSCMKDLLDLYCTFVWFKRALFNIFGKLFKRCINSSSSLIGVCYTDTQLPVDTPDRDYMTGELWLWADPFCSPPMLSFFSVYREPFLGWPYRHLYYGEITQTGRKFSHKRGVSCMLNQGHWELLSPPHRS